MVQILASMSVMSDLSREDIETMPTPEIGGLCGMGGVMLDKAHVALFPVLKRSVIKDSEASDHCAVTVVLDGSRL